MIRCRTALTCTTIERTLAVLLGQMLTIFA